MISRSPIYNLNVVLQATGVKADLLRAWERRYGLPTPQRSQGGHRLYSQYDIETVKWLRARQEERLSISRAVKLWKEILAAGRDPIGEYMPIAPATSLPVPSQDTRIDPLRNQWLEACLAFDEGKAEDILNQALAMYPVETVCMEVLQKGLSSIGEDWYTGKASVQQEHFTSMMAIRRLETLLFATPSPTLEHTVLIGCPAGERHTFPVLLLNLLLRRKGMKVVNLGADIPIEEMEKSASIIQPDLIILAAQHLPTAATLKSAVETLKSFTVGYGGSIFNRIPRLRERIQAHFLGETLEEALQQVEQLIVSPGSLPSTVGGVDDAALAVAGNYREKRAWIERSVSERMHREGLPAQVTSETNLFFGDKLQAALVLGDPAFLEKDLDWVEILFTNRQIPSGSLIPYLTVYGEVVNSEMGSVASPITGWIEAYITRRKEGSL